MTTQEFINKWTLLFADTPDKNITAEKMREFTTDAGLLIIESFTNIKTIEGQSLLGIGNIDLSKTDAGLSNVDNTSDTDKPISTLTQIALNAKQATLANGTNIKTVNGNSLLGSGNLALNFIPLTGTEVGKPITGDIEFANNSVKNIYQGTIGGNNTTIVFANDVLVISVTANTYTKSIVFAESNQGIAITDSAPGSRGLVSNIDFTQNITPLDYTQKKYVDDKFNNALSIPFILTEVSTTDNIINLQENTVYIKKYFINDVYMNTASSFNNINIILLYATTNVPVPGEEFEVYFYSSVNILLDFKYDVNGKFTITDKFSIESGKSYKLSVCMMPLRTNQTGELFPHATLDQVGLTAQMSNNFNPPGLIFDFDFEQTNKMMFDGVQKLTSYIDRGIILEQNFQSAMKPIVTPEGLYFDGIDDFMVFQNPLYYAVQEMWFVCNNKRLTIPNDVLFNDDYSNYTSLINTKLNGDTSVAINNIVSTDFAPNIEYKSISTLLRPGLEQMHIGASVNFSPSYWKGNIKRILLFSSARTEAQRTQLQAYLAQKYSL